MGVLCIQGALIEWMEGTAQKATRVRLTPDQGLANPRRSTTHRMNRTFAFVTALAAGMTSAAGVAQTAGTPAPAAASTAPSTQAAPAPVAPHAVPAKIALIEYEQAAAATNEGQRALQDLQKKYDPKKNQLQALAAEVDTLKKQLQSAPATLTDAERATRLKAIDTKEKQLNRDAEDAQTAYNADLQEAYGKLAGKVSTTLKKYVSDNGYTLLLDVSSQQSNVMWANQSTDVTQAIVAAYNTSSGVAAPAPSAPSAAHPHPSTTPKPAAPKQ